MKLIVDIPNSLYANLAKIGNGSIASKRIIECVKHGKPYKVDVLDKISAEIEEIETYDGLYIDRAYVFQIIDKYKAGRSDKE